MLEIRDLTVRYDEVVAVDRLCLDAADREVVAVLGPSGCGKSTLLRAIAGLVTPAAGTIRLDGRDLAGRRPDERAVGLTFQDHALFPHRTVADNVAFGPRVRGWSRQEVATRVTEALRLVDLEHLGQRRPHELSGGEQQRVALARAIAPRPRLLMLDEPLGSLDRVLRDRLLEELPSVFGELDATVLYVTHDHDEALTLADRVAVMRAGGVQQVGRPDELWRAPVDEDVARFLGLDQLVTGTADGRGVVATPLGSFDAPDGVTGAVSVLLLPDAVRLLGSTERPRTGERVVDAHVRGRRFAGDRVVVHLEAPAGVQLTVTTSPADAPELGEERAIGVDARAVRVLRPTVAG